MDRALFLAMTGAVHNDRAIAVHANNLANVGTTGFRADYAQARAMPVFGDAHASRVYALAETPGTRLAGGSVDQTGRSLDVALAGDGLIAVLDAAGNEAYTRAGDLAVDADGLLRTGAGFAVQGDAGALLLPASESVLVGADGTLSVRPAGQGADVSVRVGRIKLVSAASAPEGIEKGPDGLLRPRGGEVLATDPVARLTAGALETSNVNAVAELMDIIALSRQFELQVKLMQAAERGDEAAARLLHPGA
jgi:flagellar basal-body rod protein FlgF